jgi:hypothetical protein
MGANYRAHEEGARDPPRCLEDLRATPGAIEFSRDAARPTVVKYWPSTRPTNRIERSTMSGPAPVAEDALKARRLRGSTHGGSDGLSVAATVNPLSRMRRPVTADPEPDFSDYTSEHNSDFTNLSRSTPNPMHSGARGSDFSAGDSERIGLDVPEPAPAAGGWGMAAGAKRLVSSVGKAMGSAAGAAKKFTLGIPGALSRGFQSLRSSIKSNASDYSAATSTLAQHTVDPLLDRVGTKKFRPTIDSESLGWKSRAKQADGSMAIADPHESKMNDAIKAGHSSVKDLLHDNNSSLSDDERADLVKKHLLATHKLKQSGEGGLYDKAIAKARTAEATSSSARHGQVLAEASEGAIRLAGSAPAQFASHVGTALTGVSVGNVVKHGAMLAKTAGQYALDQDAERQSRAEKSSQALADSHKEMKKTFHEYREARGAWAGHKDDELSDETKAARSDHIKANFRSVFAKLKANKEDVVAQSAAGRGGEILDEYKFKHTNVVDKKTEKVAPRDTTAAGVHPQYGMPMGSDTLLGRTGQALKSSAESLEFGGKVVTGSGAQDYLDKGDYKSAAAISAGGLTTEAVSAAAAGAVPIGGGHGTKALLKGTGYAMMATGKGGAELGKKLASKQDQHDRYMDVISGKRSDDAAAHPINFQGAVSNHDPGGLQGAFEKTRDGLRDEGKKQFRKLAGADRYA